MTAFDVPDFVKGQTTVARDTVLYDTGATPQLFPIDTGSLDVSRWSSVNVAVLTDDTTTWGIGRVLITHTSQGDTVGMDYSMFQFGNNGSQIDTGTLFTFPVPGDAVQVQIDHYTAVGKARIIVIGSTRTVGRTVHPSKTLWVPPTVLAGNPTVPANGISTVGIVGPYPGGVTIDAAIPTSMGVAASAYVWDGTQLSAYPCASENGSGSNPLQNITVPAPGMVLLIELFNNNAFSQNLQYMITAY